MDYANACTIILGGPHIRFGCAQSSLIAPMTNEAIRVSERLLSSDMHVASGADNGLIVVPIADVHANGGSRRMNSAAVGHNRP
jgi:hypothetical protein